jgi:FKBP-type peptidyl-prolyl cis-trans isomerase FkpA
MKCRSRLAWMAIALLSIVPLSATMFATAAAAQDKPVLTSDRDKISYIVGLDIGNSLQPVAADVDLSAFERSVRNALDGGKPMIADAEAMAIGQALMQRAAAQRGQQIPGVAPGSEPPAVDKTKAGLFLGVDIGRSLAPMKGEIDLATVMQGIRTRFAKGTPLLADAEMDTVRKAFGERMRTKLQADAAQAGAKNAAEGRAFLDKNKTVKGVFTTPSGLQYMVLRQGAGRRPLPSDKVRVNYRGTLLDGTEFDSSGQHGGPAEFGLNGVISGWTEGVSLMPIGAKYRFWVPGDLAYGQKGTQGIGPNSTLVFDVELLDIL